MNWEKKTNRLQNSKAKDKKKCMMSGISDQSLLKVGLGSNRRSGPLTNVIILITPIN